MFPYKNLKKIGCIMHFTLQVRGFGASDRFALINMQRVNDNACAAYHSDMVQLWLSFRLVMKLVSLIKTLTHIIIFFLKIQDFIGSLLVFFTAFFCVYERASLEGKIHMIFTSCNLY
jgi:hypothetical protein